MRGPFKARRLLLAASLAFAWGCGDDNENGGGKLEVDSGVPDSGMPAAGDSDAGQSDAGPACTPVPDHLGLINAPTTTEKVDKQPVLPLLNQDGTLPPLP